MQKIIQHSLIFVSLVVFISTAIGDAFDQTVNQIKALKTESEQNQTDIEEKQTFVEETLVTEFENHALRAEKGEFESDADYAARLVQLDEAIAQRRVELEAEHLSSLLSRRLEIQTEIGRSHRTVFFTNDVTVTLETYDANTESFPILFQANDQSLSGSLFVNKSNAPDLRNNWDQVTKTAYISIDPGYRRALASVKLEYPVLWEEGVTWTFDVVYDLGNNNSIAFSPDGEYLATGSNDEYGIADIWKVEDGEKYRKMDHGDWVYAVAFSPDGQYFATAGQDETRLSYNGKAVIWDINQGTKIRTIGHSRYVQAIAFSPNSAYFATTQLLLSYLGGLSLWRVEGTGTWDASYRANTSTIQALTFNPDGEYLATGNVRTLSYLLDKATLWETSSGDVMQNFEHKNGVYAVAINPMEEYLATGNNGFVTLWEMSTGRSVRQIELPDTIAYAVTFSPDGEFLAVGKSNSYINFFHVGTEEITLETDIPRVKSIYTGSEVKDLAWHPNGNLISDGKKVYRAILQPIITDLVAKPLNTRKDVNRDGVIDIDDLVLVASNFGKSFPADANPNPDVDRNGVVGRQDVLRIIASLEANTPDVNDTSDADTTDADTDTPDVDTTDAGIGAPSARSQTVSILTAKKLQRWIDVAKQRDNGDEFYQRGISVLEQLLATLTQEVTMPTETALLPNYPNPFNPETWIPYQLSEPADVILSIYSVNGSLVRTVALGHQTAGIYGSKSRAVYWDGRNEFGELVASGLYFYTLTAAEFTATRKMLIRK